MIEEVTIIRPGVLRYREIVFMDKSSIDTGIELSPDRERDRIARGPGIRNAQTVLWRKTEALVVLLKIAKRTKNRTGIIAAQIRRTAAQSRSFDQNSASFSVGLLPFPLGFRGFLHGLANLLLLLAFRGLLCLLEFALSLCLSLRRAIGKPPLEQIGSLVRDILYARSSIGSAASAVSRPAVG